MNRDWTPIGLTRAALARGGIMATIAVIACGAAGCNRPYRHQLTETLRRLSGRPLVGLERQEDEARRSLLRSLLEE